MSGSNMVKAFHEMQHLQKFLGEWSAALNLFLRDISGQNRKLNRNWNDPRQATYHKSWGVFEDQQKKNHKTAQAISADLVELCKHMSIYLKRPVQNKQAFERLKQVQGLTGWPASARQPVDLKELVPDIKDYKTILDDFRQGLKEHIHKIMATIGRLRSCITAPKIDACRDNVQIKIKKWIEDTEKSTDMLSGFIDEIHKDLLRFM